jgi:protein phosphatase
VHDLALASAAKTRGESVNTAFAGSALIAVADSGNRSPAAAAVRVLAPLDAAGDGSDAVTRLRHAVAQVVAHFRDLTAAADPATAPPSAALTAAILVDRQIGIAHIGGSQLYLLRNRVLADLLDGTRPAPGDAQLTLLTGTEDVHYDSHTLMAGDRLLICSSGVVAAVDVATMTDAMNRAGTPADTAERLLEAATTSEAPAGLAVVVADAVAVPAGR